jgi:hypothetical protein
MSRRVPRPNTPRAFSCRCGRPVFFRNSQCLNCGAALGYAPSKRRLLALEPAGDDGSWRESGAARSRRYRRCANLHSACACNWLVEARGAAPTALCRCCRLTRTLPDLSLAGNALRWLRIEQAKRQLLSSLLGLGLAPKSKAEDPQHGLAFDLLQTAPGAAPIVTGHADGVITLDVEEADDAQREQRREALGEPYRTLLGHLRHEIGHFHWQQRVANSEWLEPFRALFGDERADYAAALQSHHAYGPPADWATRHVSAYAAAHPWEDWAETWAHYLHMVDTLDTARSFGLDGERVELAYERFGEAVLGAPGDAAAARFVPMLNAWMELTGVLNELSRSMGLPDFYPFVLSAAAARKLLFVHRLIDAPNAPGGAGGDPAPGDAGTAIAESAGG